MQMKCSSTLTPRTLRPSRLPRSGRVVSSFASESFSDQVPGLDEIQDAGLAVFEILSEEAVEVAAEVSRVQAEQMKILQRLPEDPQGTINEFMQDVQNRGIPSPTDVIDRAASVVGSIQIKLDEQFSSPTPPARPAGDEIDENAPPEMPDPQALVKDVKAEAAAARSAVKAAVDNKKI